MGATKKAVTVRDKSQLDATITKYIGEGYTVEQQGDSSVTMFRKKKFDLGKYFLGLLLCVVPGIIYVFKYWFESNKMVVITVDSAQPGIATAPSSAKGPNIAVPAPSAVTPPSGDANDERVAMSEGWFQDPVARHPDRYWDGASWTGWVRDKPGGTRLEDPLAESLAADWYPDPVRRHPHRYWDGTSWTKWVRDKSGGTRTEDVPE